MDLINVLKIIVVVAALVAFLFVAMNSYICVAFIVFIGGIFIIFRLYRYAEQQEVYE